ncbi:MAG TPA: Gmad2 immunoglobulin-like domain-containing protein [Candidatus Paceibacterota bacterium]
MQQKTILVSIAILLIIGSGIAWKLSNSEPSPRITNFEECVAAGNPVMESYPRQCQNNGEIFVEDVGNELDKTDLIRLNTPRSNTVVESPLVIKGEARGFWFFEASFPVMLTDWDGRIIARGIATAQRDWMTENFVPFEAQLVFTIPADIYSKKGTLILMRDNPSGLPENDDALEIPVVFAEGDGEVPVACTQEAKLCPDGSYVGRTGPHCEFAQCPSFEGGGSGILPFKSGVHGTVLRGPTCAVVQNHPDPRCEDMPFETTVQIFAKNGAHDSPFSIVSTDKAGNYAFSLPPGEYTLVPLGGEPFPNCSSTGINIEPDVMSTVDLFCDTGIR